MSGALGTASNDQVGDQMAEALLQAIVALVRGEGTDLSARQFGIFLMCYLRDEAQTVRGLAADLNIAKPAVCRALHRLAEFDLVRRKIDPLDRRSIFVQWTAAGTGFLRDLKRILTDAAQEANGRGRFLMEQTATLAKDDDPKATGRVPTSLNQMFRLPDGD
jgi:DNA-binding MarR family transcriptional regulator